jgi:stage V sporulation protein AD
MPGIVVEKGIADANNMGAAMAPAALDTLLAYFEATGKAPCDFDGIYTGDLGAEGSSILGELLEASGVSCGDRLFDCGVMIYDRKRQDVHAGGSGCGCSAVVAAAHLLPELCAGKQKSILFIGTGAMMSPSSSKQGNAIPAVAHLVHLTGRGRE